MIYPDQIIKTNRQTMSLSIQRNGAIIVRAPSRMKDEQIKKFIMERQGWLEGKLLEIKTNQNYNNKIINYEQFLLYGSKYELKIADVRKIEIYNGQILVPKKDESKIIQTVINFYKRQAKQVFAERINYLQQVMKIEPKSVKLSNSSGRWGACNSRGSITLNWRVVMLSPECIDYVLVHEMCHLVEMNHSKRFWNLVATFLPNFNDLRKNIKNYGFLLELYR